MHILLFLNNRELLLFFADVGGGGGGIPNWLFFVNAINVWPLMYTPQTTLLVEMYIGL